MNDFHILTLCIEKKDVAGAMRVLRDKSEFAMRKILEKLKVRVPALTGRAFWHDVQRWLLAACRRGKIQHESVRNRSAFQPAKNQASQSGCAGHDQAGGASGHVARSHQYAACFKTSRRDLTGEPHLINDTSFGYELKTPDPVKMDAGIYTGELKLIVGPGGDIDFGDNFQASDTELRINIALSVNHELKLTTTADAHAVSLQPCASGRICTADEGSANWERWMINQVTPELTGRSDFSLSSSGTFTVYLECEQQSGPDCALQSDNSPSQTVPVQSLLTLPNNIVDSFTGSVVSKRRLAVGKDSTKNVFTANSFVGSRAGSIDFMISQKDVDTILKTRPDTYRGAVTVIFDPQLH